MREYGKLRARPSLCAQACAVGQSLLLCCAVIGRSGVCNAFFAAKSREKPKISVKTEIFGGNRAGLCRREWIIMQQYGKSRAQSQFCARVNMVTTIIIIMYRRFALRCVRVRRAVIFRRKSGKIWNNCAVGGEGLTEQWERKEPRAAAVLRASERGSSAARLPHCHAGGFDANGRVC